MTQATEHGHGINSEWEQTNFTRASQINCVENVIKVVPNFAVGFVDIPKTS